MGYIALCSDIDLHRFVVGLWMFLFRENLCGKTTDALKQRSIPKSELAGSTSLQAAVLQILRLARGYTPKPPW